MTTVPIYKQRRAAFRYLEAIGLKREFVNRDVTDRATGRRRRTRKVVRFECGCEIQASAYPMHSSFPKPCDKHRRMIYAPPA